MTQNKKLFSERGAIMLEVVAVLSLMGLMGAMMFRQIYQRNQELHNIQMASEIRIVKEAMSAWLQGNASILANRTCHGSSGDTTLNNSTNPRVLLNCDVTEDDINAIAEFLPDGYLFDPDPAAGGGGAGEYLNEYYDFKLFGYWRGNNDNELIPTFYGVIVPKPAVLPDEGKESTTWNFRRAARVAMLIGIDGGAYGKGITQEGVNDIVAGAVGTWSLVADDIITRDNNTHDCNGDACPTYVALTQLDVFQPEIELPDVQVGVPRDWDTVHRDLHAYNYFSVGGDKPAAGGADPCFTINHENATLDPVTGRWEIQGDTINTPNANCLPAFWVESKHTDEAGNPTAKETGKVFVLNELNIGPDSTDPRRGEAAITLTKEGRILFKEKVKDPQNEKKETNYMLDPAYTSVMNDIKLMSRGGAKLSELVPDYILKLVQATESGQARIEIDNNYCPAGYKLAIVATPVSWSAQKDLGKLELIKEQVGVTVTGSVSVSVSGSPAESGSITASGTTDKAVFREKEGGETADAIVVLTRTDDTLKRRSVYIGTDETVCSANSSGEGSGIKMRDNVTNKSGEGWHAADNKYKYYACFGWGEGPAFSIDTNAHGVVQIYCVYDRAAVTANNIVEFKDGGGASIIPKGKPDSIDASECATFKSEGTCKLFECDWDGSACKAQNPGGGQDDQG